MTEFTKTKIMFVLALLGTLFALHPFVERMGNAGFVYLDVKLEVFEAYSLFAGLLAFTVYCYAAALLTEHSNSWMERAGNYSYAFAVIVLPLYMGLWAASELALWAGQSDVAWAAPAVAIGVGVMWLLLSQVMAWRLRKHLGDQDQSSKTEFLAKQEIASLNRAGEMFAQQHYDLSVIENWRAIELRLRRVLLQKDPDAHIDNPDKLIEAARVSGIVGEANLALILMLRNSWTLALSTEPVTREIAETAMQSARKILSTIAVANPSKK